MKNFLWGHSLYLYITAATAFVELEPHFPPSLPDSEVGILGRIPPQDSDGTTDK